MESIKMSIVYWENERLEVLMGGGNPLYVDGVIYGLKRALEILEKEQK
ncbi:hypothetical protein PSPHG_CDS_0126 [Pseudomonas phage Psxphi15]